MMWKILPFFVALFVVGLGSLPHGGIPGGIQDISPNNPGFQRAMHYAVDKYNRKSDEENIYKIDKVIKAQSQVVKGVKYIMTLKMVKTFCTKHRHPGFCPIITNPEYARVIYCSFIVLEFDGLRLLEFRCGKKNPWD